MFAEPVRHPGTYRWYVLLASMDVLLTWLILANGGNEANVIARWVIEQAGMPGAAFFKFMTVGLVLVTCEFLARVDAKASQFVAWMAVVISTIPIAVGLLVVHQLLAMGVTIRI